MSGATSTGRALQIVSIVDHKLVFHKNELKKVTNKCTKVPNVSLAIYSVSGLFRKGKSFLLNLLLLHDKDPNTDLSHSTETLTGFTSDHGVRAVTSGIWIWSEPIVKMNKNGDKVAILLLDTQGTFDMQTPNHINSFLIGFSMAISSVTLYNIKECINEQDIQNLATFGNSFFSTRPEFQSLKFVVRDWIGGATYGFGAGGGNRHVEEALSISDLQAALGVREANEGENTAGEDRQKELDQEKKNQIEMRIQVKKLFPKGISGILFPFPGEETAFPIQQYPPAMQDIKPHFLHVVQELYQELFVENIAIRVRHDGTKWNVDTLLNIFEETEKNYKGGKIMNPGTNFDGLNDKLCRAATKAAYFTYCKLMESALKAQKEETLKMYVDNSFLRKEHESNKVTAIGVFRHETKYYPYLSDRTKDLKDRITNWFAEKNAANDREIELKDQRANNQELWDEANAEHERRIGATIGATSLALGAAGSVVAGAPVAGTAAIGGTAAVVGVGAAVSWAFRFFGKSKNPAD